MGFIQHDRTSAETIPSTILEPLQLSGPASLVVGAESNVLSWLVRRQFHLDF